MYLPIVLIFCQIIQMSSLTVLTFPLFPNYPFLFTISVIFVTLLCFNHSSYFSLSKIWIFFVLFSFILMFFFPPSLPLYHCHSLWIYMSPFSFIYIADEFSVLQLNLTINKPNSEARCQYFDPSLLEATINSVTNRRVMVTNVSGSNLCDINPCSPSPCNNGGTCSLKNVIEGYECTCTQGYSGINCSLDINECDLGWYLIKYYSLMRI